MFLEAPRNVMDALVCYIKQEDKNIDRTVKAFIEDKLKDLNYSHVLDQSKLSSQGNIYNLDRIYEALNEEYFEGKLKLSITWFGKPTQRSKTRFTFGLYHEPVRLIKINKVLDSPSFPDYLISYVIYHEMLHHVCPSYIDVNGNSVIHTGDFKEKEAHFKYFDLAQQWIKKHQANLFI